MEFGRAAGHQVGPLQRVDRDVDHDRRLGIAHLLADVQHGRLVALALADDDRAAQVGRVHRLPHGLDGGPVRAVLVAAAHLAGGGQRRRLGGGHRLIGDQLVPLSAHRSVRIGQCRKCRRPVKTMAIW